MTSPLDVPIQSDVGADTFQRYRYQARALIPAAIACGCRVPLNGERVLLSIVTEQHEDAILETNVGWVAIQIKTRLPSLGPWRWTDVAGPSGGMRHLARTSQYLGSTIAAFELWLEGVVSGGDVLAQFQVAIEGRIGMSDLADSVAPNWGMSPADIIAFFGKTRVVTCPPQNVIDAINRDLASDRFPLANRSMIKYAVNAILAKLSNSMDATREGVDFLRAVVEGRVDAPTRERTAQKLISRRDLEEILSLMTRPLLSAQSQGTQSQGILPRLPGSEGVPYEANDARAANSRLVSDLERKLLEAGATPDLVIAAQSLRAAASQRETGWLAASRADPGHDALLDDLRARLLVLAAPIAAQYRGLPGRAGRVFREVRQDLSQELPNLDIPGLVGNDANVLLGMVCGLSDECKVDWGGPEPVAPQ